MPGDLKNNVLRATCTSAHYHYFVFQMFQNVSCAVVRIGLAFNDSGILIAIVGCPYANVSLGTYKLRVFFGPAKY